MGKNNTFRISVEFDIIKVLESELGQRWILLLMWAKWPAMGLFYT